MRWVVDQAPLEAANEVIRELRERDATLRNKVVRLRGQLHELEREAVNLGVIAPASIDQIQVA